jgi:hypothetical protein
VAHIHCLRSLVSLTLPSSNPFATILILLPLSNLITIPIIYIFYPETGSRSLEEIDLLFQHATEAGKPWFSVVGISKKEPRWFDKNGQPTESSIGSSTIGGSEMGSGEKLKCDESNEDSNGRSDSVAELRRSS